MTTLLLLKLLLVPGLIAALTWAAHRWGPAVAGWLSGFPVVAGPILLFLALERGAAFAALAAVGTLTAVIPALVFALGYAWSARHGRWPASLAAALTLYAAAVLILDELAPSVPLAAALVMAALLLAPRLFPPAQPFPYPAPPGQMNVILRMLAGAALVLLITGFAADLGAHLSGMLAMFPVLAFVLAVFTHSQSGAAYATRLLHGMVRGYYAFAVFCLVLALGLPRLPMAAGFGAAFSCAGLIQLASSRRLRAG